MKNSLQQKFGLLFGLLFGISVKIFRSGHFYLATMCVLWPKFLPVGNPVPD
jgi:hypothetical protein